MFFKKSLFLLAVAGAFLIPQVVASETSAVSKLPSGWSIKGSRVDDYEVGLDSSVQYKGRPAAFVKSKGATTIDGFSTLTQKISAEKYVGKRLKLTGWLKSKDIVDSGGLWMRVDAGVGNAVAFDNMENRPVKGTTDWKQYSCVLDVPLNATQVSYGILLYSAGTLWGQELALTEVGKDVPVTDLVTKEVLPVEPINMNFAQEASK